LNVLEEFGKLTKLIQELAFFDSYKNSQILWVKESGDD